MNRWVRLILAVLAGSLVAAPAVVHAATYTYCAPAIERLDVDVEEVGNVGWGRARVSEVPERSASRSVQLPGTSTTLTAAVVATNTGGLAKYDPDFALGQVTSGGRATASQLDEFGAAQGWVRSQTATGPIKYTDANGVVRVTIKKGSPRAPGSGSPHVEMRNEPSGLLHQVRLLVVTGGWIALAPMKTRFGGLIAGAFRSGIPVEQAHVTVKIRISIVSDDVDASSAVRVMSSTTTSRSRADSLAT
jgi:hypothetical protein